MRRWAYRKLIGRADVLTTLARNNAELCRRYLRRDALQVYYGLNTQDFPLREPQAWSPRRPLRIAAIGNDRDRDWKTFVAAFGGDSRYDVRLATRRRIARALHAPNVEIAPASGIVKQRELYDWADLIVVPLRPNTRCAFAQPFSPILRGNATHSTWFDSSLPVASSRQKRGTIRHDSENESGAVEPMRPSTKYSVFSVRSCMPAEM